MKPQKIIITLSAAAALTVGILVACSKDATQHQATDTPVAPAAKSLSAAQYMYQIWEKSDSAYRKNPTAFLSTCNLDSYNGFLEITNIADTTISAFEKAVVGEAAVALGTLGMEWCDNECLPCAEGGLPGFGQNIAQLRRVLDTLIVLNSPDTLPNFMPYMDSCMVLCKEKKELTGKDLDWCVFNCNLRRAIRDHQLCYMAITNKPWKELE